MSTPTRSRHVLIGCNIKPGHVPGGFTLQCRKKMRRTIGTDKTKETPDATLAAQGFIPAPSPSDRAVFENKEEPPALPAG